jgi:hypothetical protein
MQCPICKVEDCQCSCLACYRERLPAWAWALCAIGFATTSAMFAQYRACKPSLDYFEMSHEP